MEVVFAFVDNRRRRLINRAADGIFDDDDDTGVFAGGGKQKPRCEAPYSSNDPISEPEDLVDPSVTEVGCTEFEGGKLACKEKDEKN